MNSSATRCWAVLAAAGSGSRFGASFPKQYATLGGHTILERSLRVLCDTPGVDGVLLVVSAEDEVWPELELTRDPRVRVVTGGRERADSVFNALQALEGGAAEQDWVLVHDAARPCVTPEEISGLLALLADDPVGGLWALPMVDTVKQVEDNRVLGTVPRTSLWRAQTPQIFRFGLLHRAMSRHLASGVEVTDESSALEQMGYQPRVVEGLATNLKITRKEDLALAACYLEQRGLL